MVRFSAKPKNEPHFPSLARAKRARDAKNAFRLCPSLSNIIVFFLLASLAKVYSSLKKKIKR
ncbi:MAG: hypothetical protein U5L45_01365 [Saprospiraceae bacterium]|nr:hypothetical protein [Saprospiraceae bacterium]